MLHVNDFAHHGTVGDCQLANNIYSLTARTEAADFLLPAAVSPFLNKQTRSYHTKKPPL